MRQWALILLISLPCQAQSRPLPVPTFEDISKQAGLKVSHITSSYELYIMESTSGGVGFIDCDNDGKLDIVVAGGSSVERFRRGGDPMVTLYHQEAELKFKDITQSDRKSVV